MAVDNGVFQKFDSGAGCRQPVLVPDWPGGPDDIRLQICSAMDSQRIQETLSCAGRVLVYINSGQFGFIELFNPPQRPGFYAGVVAQYPDLRAQSPFDSQARGNDGRYTIDEG